MAYPTIFNASTGEWEEVNEEEAQAEFGIPIGPSRASGEVRGDTGFSDIPSPTEGPSSYWDNSTASNTGTKPQLWASTEQGVPSGYQYPTAEYDPTEGLDDDQQKYDQEQRERDLEEKGLEDHQVPPESLPSGMVMKNATTYDPRTGLPEGMNLLGPDGKPETQQQQAPIAYNVDLYPKIADMRKPWVDEIYSNPKLREFAAAAVSLEAGDKDSILGVVESLFNRTQQRKSTIVNELTNGFYGPVNRGEVDARVRRGVEPWMYKQFDEAMDAVRNGSNLIEGRTDQGMHNEIVGPKARYGTEYFGYMGGDPTWSMQFQKNIGEPGGATAGAYRAEDAGLPPGMKLISQGGQAQGLPEGMTLKSAGPQAPSDQQAPVGQAAPTRPAVTSQQLPSGEMAPMPSGEEGVITPASPVQEPLPRLSPQVARQMGLNQWIDQDTGREVRRAEMAEGGLPVRAQAEKKKAKEEPHLGINVEVVPPREKLQQAIAKVEAEGVKVPHFIGTKDEPEGDRAPTMDMENLVTGLTKQMNTAAKKGDVDKAVDLNKQIKYWKEQIATKGMTQEQAKEPDPKYPKTKDQELRDLMTGKEERKNLLGEYSSRIPEYGARIARGAEKGVERWQAGTRQIAAETLRSERQPYLFKTAKQAADDVPRLTNELNAKMEELRKKATEMEGGGAEYAKSLTPLEFGGVQEDPSLTPLVQEIRSISSNLTAASRAAAGDFSESFAGTLSRSFEELADEDRKALTEIDQKYQGKVLPAHDKEFWMMVSDSVGESTTAIPATWVNPVFGLTVMAAQSYEGHRDEFLEKHPGDVEGAHKYAMPLMMLDTPMEMFGEVKFTKAFKKGIESAAKKGTKEAWSTFIKERAKDFGESALGESGLTTPVQSIIGQVGKEVAGLQPVTTWEDKLKQAGKESLVALGQSAVMASGGVGISAATKVGVDAARTEKGPFSKEAASAAARLSEGKFKSFAELPEQVKPKEGAPAEPVRETVTEPSPRVKSTDGRRGEVVEEKEGKITVKWEDDDSKSTVTEKELQPRKEVAKTVNKNVVSVGETGKKGATLEYYDEDGKRQVDMVFNKGTKEENQQAATAAAEELSKRQNITGYFDQDGNHVRTAPTEAEKAAQVAETAKAEVQKKQDRVAEITQEIEKTYDPEEKAKLVHEAIKLSEEIEAAQPAPAEAAPETVTQPTQPVSQPGKRTEPTYEVQPAKEEGGKEQLVPKNLVEVLPSGKKTVVNHYDANGNKTTKSFGSEKEARQHAAKVVDDNNLVGHVDVHDDWTMAPEATPAATTPAATPVAPKAAAPTTLEETVPVASITPETPEEEQTSQKYVESVLRFAKKIPKRIRKAARDLYDKRYEQSKKTSLRDQVAIWHNKGWHKRLENVFDYLRREGSDQGIPIVYTEHDDPDMKGTPAAVYTRDGKDVLLVNPFVFGAMIDAARDAGGEKAAERFFRAMVQEETLHAAENVAMENRWNSFAPEHPDKKKYKSWRAYQDAQYEKMLRGMKADAKGGAIVRNDRWGVAQALKAAYNVYFAFGDEKLTKAAGAFTGAPEEIWDHLIGSNKLTGKGLQFMPEFLRQLNQQKLYGRITEQTHAYFTNKVMQWVRDAVRSIRWAAKASASGTFGHDVAVALHEVEKEVFNAENLRALANHGYAQSAKQGTKEYKEWAGNSILIDPKTGINKIVYHATQGDFDEFMHTKDMGFHFGSMKAAWDRAKALGADAHDADGWNVMPMTLRLETPVYLKDMGMWPPSSVLYQLVKRGYVTQKDADWLIDFHGEPAARSDPDYESNPGLTNKDIVEHLQEKGYDGVVYRNVAEGLRTLTKKEAEEKNAELTIQKSSIMGSLSYLAIDKSTGETLGSGPTPEAARADMVKYTMSVPMPWDDSYIVFTGNQAKSAMGNEGAYSREDSRVTKAKPPGERSMESIAMEQHNTTGGSSINAQHGNLAGKEFFSVGVFPELNHPVPGEKLTLQDWHDFRDKLVKAGIDPNSASKTIGTWYNKETGNSEFDLSATVPDLRAALEIGQEYNQEAIYDHLTGGVVYVQGVRPGPGITLPSIGERAGFVAGKAAPRAADTWPIFKPVLSDPYSFNAENLPPGKIEEVSIISDDDIEASAKRGKDWKDWYETYDKYMRWLTAKHPDYRPLYAWWFAATSPHNLVGANITASMKAFRNFIATGDPAVPGPGMPGFMKTHWPNLRRATGLPSGAVAEPKAVGGGVIGGGVGLTGGKVPEFAPALLNDPYAIAVDMHVASVLFGTENPSEWQRFAGQMAILRISKRMGWNPAEVQAALFADDIMQRQKTKGGKSPLARAEDYMQKYEQEFQRLVEADQSEHGGKGAGIGRSILERVSQRIGPERFLSTTAANIQSIRDARKAAVTIKINPEIASTISLSGPSRLAGAKGAPPTGTLPAQRKVVAGPMGLSFLFNGTKQVFWNSPGLKGLGNAVHKLGDLAGRYKGEYINPLVKWESKMWDVPELRPRLKAAANEHQEYREAKAGGQPLPKMGTDAKNLAGVIDGLMAKVNAKNKAENIKVHDPLTGKLVQVPQMDFPSMVKESVISTMRDPHMNVAEYNKLKDDMIAEHILPAGTTDTEFSNYVEKLIKSHDKNGTFNRFFFNPKLLPSKSYDYSYAAVTEFLQGWTEKLAQREALGENPNHDIFDIAVEHMTDPSSINYVKNVKAMAYGRTVNDVFGRFAIVAGQFASIKHLAGPVAATKNWLGGMLFNATNYGVINFTKGFFLNNPYRAVDDAFERGILTRDLMNVAADGELTAGLTARVSTAAAGIGYYYSGYKGAENWVRGVGMRAAESMLRDVIKLYNKNPRGPRVLRYMAHFKRLGIENVDALLQEKGKGEVTNSYLRASVNAAQGGYTFADVPAYMETPVGKWMFKYKKWGIEQVKNFVREVAMPAARGARLAPAEKITLPDASGNDQTVTVPRSVTEMIPLARYLVLGIMAGAGQEWLLEKLFGMHPKTMRIADALAKFREGNVEGYKALVDKLWNWSLSVGSFGSLGNFVQSGLMAAGIQKGGPQQALFEALPSLDPFNQLWDQLKIAYEQKGFTSKNWFDLLSQMAFTKGYSELAATQARDVFGIQYRLSKDIAAKQDMSLLRNVQRRYEEDVKFTKKSAPPLGRPPKDVTSKWRDKLDDALYVGDIAEARQIIADAKKGMSPQRWDVIEKDALKTHIKSKEPISAAGGGEAAHMHFKNWMKDNLNIYDRTTIERLDKTYRDSARALGEAAVEWKPPQPKDVGEYMQRLKLKAEETAY